ncbi:MAG: nuclease-related domain-containing protein [Candidatus Hodarchaeales archaeon]|jgi:hypothetical protein
MANKQYITENRLLIEANKERTRVFIKWSIIIIVTTFIFYDLIPEFPVVAIGVCFFLFIKFLARYYNAGSITRAGAEGELKALKYLEKLPDHYYILNQVEIPDQKGSYGVREIDYIVVGPNGVFLVEVKNISGLIKGKDTDKTLDVIKTDKYGIKHHKKEKNPFHQIKIQRIVLQKFLKQYRIYTPIQGMVLFVHPKVRLEIKNNTTIPFFQCKKMLTFINDFVPENQVYKPDYLSSLIYNTTSE